MPLSLVFATTPRGIFSIGSNLPWKCHPDMSYFRALTKGSTVLMGRKTADTLKTPLPDRRNLVLTRNKYPRDGFEKVTFSDFPNLWEKEDVFAIGGIELIEYLISEFPNDISMVSQSFINENKYPPGEIPEGPVRTLDINYHSLSMKVFDDFLIADGVAVRVSFNKYFEDTLLTDMDKQYLQLGKEILENRPLPGRNGLTRSSFDPQFVISADFKDGFPVLKSKRVWMQGVFDELDFFWEGKTDTLELEEKGIKIWNGNTCQEFLERTGKADFLRPGQMGPMYGYQWRHYGADYQDSDPKKGFDQIERLIEGIIQDPYSRRHLLTVYNPAQAEDGVLYPCHSIATQFYIKDQKISMKTYQRSADWFLGVPFNLSSNAYLLIRVIQDVNHRLRDRFGPSSIQYTPGKVTTVFGDAHIYEDHVPVFCAQVANALFTNKIGKKKTVFDPETRTLVDYKPAKGFFAKMIA